MKRFRVIVELEATDIVEAGDIASAFTDDGRVKDWKLQKVYGKRKPKSNPNQLNLTGIYESAVKMEEKINQKNSAGIHKGFDDNVPFEA